MPDSHRNGQGLTLEILYYGCGGLFKRCRFNYSKPARIYDSSLYSIIRVIMAPDDDHISVLNVAIKICRKNAPHNPSLRLFIPCLHRNNERFH